MFWLFKKSQYNVFIIKFIYAKALKIVNVRFKKISQYFKQQINI